ncbi:methionyl-tRNA formyltransferase [Nitrospira sp. Nam74]
MRIVFMGTPQFAVPSLEALLHSEDSVVGVVTQPDKPKGRGQTMAISPIKQLAEKAGVPILQPLKMKDPAFLDALRAWQPDLIAVTAFGRILPPVILDLPPKGCVNVHGSLLPKYRGAGPIQWALINGEAETGITTMLMDAGMDTGAMLLQERVPIDAEDTAGSLSEKLGKVGGPLLVETIRRLKAGTLTPRPQDNSQATMAPLLEKEMGQIDWTSAAIHIANRVRGLSPWPGAFTHAGQERWTIWKVRALGDPTTAEPGTVVGVTKEAIQVATGLGLLAILELQPANSRRMAVQHYLAGHRLTPGFRLHSSPQP